MKKYSTFLVMVCSLATSLYATEGKIKREFTVTQIALEIQQAQMALEESTPDGYTLPKQPTQNQTKGGDKEQ